MEELLKSEENYILALENGITHYLSALKCESLPKCLRGKKKQIFGNIEKIYEFHKNKFYPNLLQCGGDVVKTADLFTSFITNDYFYEHVTYGTFQSSMNKFSEQHDEFWKVNNFLKIQFNIFI